MAEIDWDRLWNSIPAKRPPMHSNCVFNQGSKMEQVKAKQKRGFASMDPAMVKKIASMGGQAAHEQGVAHKWNSEQAREAGRKGGLAMSRKRLTDPKYLDGTQLVKD